MKRFISAFASIVWAILVVTVPVCAQEHTITANALHDFLGNRVVPTGTYRISSLTNAFQNVPEKVSSRRSWWRHHNVTNDSC